VNREDGVILSLLGVLVVAVVLAWFAPEPCFVDDVTGPRACVSR
jgi:hypothetical protein